MTGRYPLKKEMVKDNVKDNLIEKDKRVGDWLAGDSFDPDFNPEPIRATGSYLYRGRVYYPHRSQKVVNYVFVIGEEERDLANSYGPVDLCKDREISGQYLEITIDNDKNIKTSSKIWTNSSSIDLLSVRRKLKPGLSLVTKYYLDNQQVSADDYFTST